MAQTQLHNYSVQEKLNKMDVDVITVSATMGTGATDATIMFPLTEIPNAVAVNGGACIIHSITAVLADNPDDDLSVATNMTNSFRLVFSNDSTTLGVADAAITTEGAGPGELNRDLLDGIQGFTDIAAIQDFGELAIGSKTNAGLLAKAESDSRSLYVTGITQSGDDYNGGTITLNIGIVKD